MSSEDNADERVVNMSRIKSAFSISLNNNVCELLKKNAPEIERSVNAASSLAQEFYTQPKPTYYDGLTPLIPPPALQIHPQLKWEREALPIRKQKSEILRLLDTHPVLILKSATGSGKSTQVPQYLMEDATQKQKAINIMVTQPRRIAATSVAARIAKERGEVLGKTVGYQIRMDKICSKETACTLTTSGYLRNWISFDKQQFLNDVTHLIVDEVHERDVDTDFILLACKMALTRGMKIQIILMSATIDLPALSAYFDNAPILNVGKYRYSVQTYQLEDVLVMTGYKKPYMLSDGDSLLAYRKHNAPLSIDYKLIVSLIEMLLEKGQKGAVIVYLPGYLEILKTADHLKDVLKNESIRVLMLHSHMEDDDDDDDDLVFKVFKDVQLKVVLSTNIGQTSITIEDLLYVIDAGVVKAKTYDLSVNASQLASQWISKADAKQRTGRVGRCKNGVCYRLYSTEEYGAMKDYIVPQILQSSLDEVCLQLKIFAPNEPITCTLLKALQPPAKEAIEQACKNLKQFNLLADNNEPVESITELGKIVAVLPVDVQFGKCVIYSLYYGCFNTMIIIASYFSMPDPFLIPKKKRERFCQINKRTKYGIPFASDVIGSLSLYSRFKEVCLNQSSAAKFCKKEGLSLDSMSMFLAAVEDLRKTMFQHFPICQDIGKTEYDSNHNMLRLALLAGFNRNIAHLDRSPKNTLVGENDSTMKICNKSFLTSFRATPHDWILFITKFINSSSSCYPIVGNLTCLDQLIVALHYGKTCVLELNEELAHVNLADWISIELDRKLGDHFLNLRKLIELEFRAFVNNRFQRVDYSNRAPKMIAELLLVSSRATKDAKAENLPLASVNLKLNCRGVVYAETSSR